MKVLLALTLLAVSASAGNFKWKSCGDNRKVVINKISVSPDPLTFPGKVSFDVDAELKEDVKDVSMSVKIVRNTFLLDITLPCVQQIGSCSYKRLCTFVDDMIREDWGFIGKKIGAQILKSSKKNITTEALCANGVRSQLIKSSQTLNIPELPSILSFIAEGDYTVQIVMNSNTDGSNIVCLEANAKLVKDSSGSIWGKRRVRSLQLF